MTPESPIDPRQALEASLTALLLGELPPDQAAFLRQVMSGDPELAKIYQRLKQTIDLVRETETAPPIEAATEQTTIKLSDNRRTALLQHFKTIAPREFAKPPKRRVSWLLPVAAAVAVTGLLAAMMLPALTKSKSKSQALSFRTWSLDRGESAGFQNVAPPSERSPALIAQHGVDNLKEASTAGGKAPLATASPAPPAPAVPPNQTVIVLPQTAGAADQGTLAAAALANGVTTVTLNGGDLAYRGYDISRAKSEGDKPLMLGLGFDKVAHVALPALQAPTAVPPASSLPIDQSAALYRFQSANEPAGSGLIASAGGGGGGYGGGIGGGGLPPRVRYGGAPPSSPAVNIAGRALGESGSVPSAEALYANRFGDDLSLSGANGNVERQRTLEKKPTDQSKLGLNETAGETSAALGAIDPTTGLPIDANSRSGGIAGTVAEDVLGRRYGVRPGSAPTAPVIDPMTGLPVGAFQPVDPTTGLPVAIVEHPLRAQAQNNDTSAPTSNLYSLNMVGHADVPFQPSNWALAGDLRGFYNDQEQNKKDNREILAKERSTIVLPEAGLRRQPADFIDGFSPGTALGATGPNAASRAPSATAASTSGESAIIESKRGELNQLLASQRTLDLNLLAERTDLSLPKSSMVEIVEKAVPSQAQNQGFLGRIFGGESEARARIKIEPDQADIHSVRTVQTGVAYDPYFIQSEFEVIQSDAVLGKVIKDLNLNKAWAKSAGAAGELKTTETLQLLKKKLDLRPVRNTSLVEIGVKDSKPEEAANIANAIAETYLRQRTEQRMQLGRSGVEAAQQVLAKQEQQIREVKEELARLENPPPSQQVDAALPKPANPIPIPQPEIQTRENAFSTFSLNVSDVSFKLAAASLEKGVLPDPASIRSEEFINAFDYRDPEAPSGVPIAFAWERSRYPFVQNRDLLRFSLKTAALGRQAGRPLNLVLLLDNSGSMERADRVSIIREALRVLATQLQPQDTFSVVTFARTAHLWVDGVPGNQAGQVGEELSKLTPQGGTNLGEAMDLAYQTALRHYLANGINRVVLLTDGAANLGDVEPSSLKAKVETNRKQGIALDCFGIGWEGYNDDLLEVLTRNGDGRYGFINTPEEAATEFAGQLAGALQVAASDVKVQVEFNPNRVTSYRQVGYAKHQLTKEQFRDNTVNAAQIGAAESGNALYVVEANPVGEGPLGIVRVRYRVPGTSDYQEREWVVPYTGNAVALEQSSPAMRLAASAGAFSEWLATSPYAAEVTPDALLRCLSGVPQVYGVDTRPQKLEWMLRQAKSVSGTK